MNSSLVKGKVERKLASRTGFKVKVGQLYWSPSHDFELKNLTFSGDGGGEVRVRRVEVEPYYQPLMSKRVKLRRLIVESPEMICTDSDLKQWLAKFKKEVGVPPVVSSSPKPPVVAAVPAVPSNPPVKPNPSGEPATPPVAAKKPKAPVKPEPATVSDEFPLEELLIRGGLIRVEKAQSGGELVHLEGVDLDLPVGAELGTVSVREARLWGSELTRAFNGVLRNTEFGMELEPMTAMLGKAEVQLRAGVSPSGQFYQQAVTEVEEVKLQRDWGAVAGEKFLGKCLFRGLLRKPSTWSVEVLSTMQNLQIKHPSKVLDFETVSIHMVATASKGLEVRQMRGDSPELMFVAQGQVRTDGSLTGVCRVMATEEEAKDIYSFTGGLGVRFPMKAWKESDLYYHDVFFRGEILDPEFKSVRYWRNLKKTLQQADRFLTLEGQETLRGQ